MKLRGILQLHAYAVLPTGRVDKLFTIVNKELEVGSGSKNKTTFKTSTF